MYVVGLGNGVEHAAMAPRFGHHHTLAQQPRPVVTRKRAEGSAPARNRPQRHYEF